MISDPTASPTTVVWWAYDDSDCDEWQANALFGDEQHALAYAQEAWARAERNQCADHEDKPEADCEDCQGCAAYIARLEQLARARQKLAHGGTGYVPPWDSLTAQEREMGVLDAQNYLAALALAAAAHPTPGQPRRR